jgi:hypothetical protein
MAARYLWPPGAGPESAGPERRRVGADAGRMLSSTVSGNADVGELDRSACSRPGSSRWPGLRRKNVTVSLALTAAPITAPLSPLMPLGRSTATTGTPVALIASIIARAGLRPAGRGPRRTAHRRSRPPASAAGVAASTGPCQRRAASAASPFSLSRSPSSSSRTG